ncbi:MAG: RNA repair transcriptional activator RtcR [Planctomycetota bacterium]
MPRPTVVLSLLGLTKDRAFRADRWNLWRPTVSLAQQEHLIVDRLELLSEKKGKAIADVVAEDITTTSPETEVRHHRVTFRDPWDFADVYEALSTWAESYEFDEENEDYLIHITTGTHVAQICWFLLAESRRVPARLIQTSPPRPNAKNAIGTARIIDLDLSRYDRLASRFEREQQDAVAFLKAGIPTRNERFNALIERIETVALRSEAPILLEGRTGVGKTQLAGRIYELKHQKHQVQGPFVQVNCATLRGDSAMSTLFGHEKGAFTGAQTKRKGLLQSADQGLLFLDEIGELGLDEQAMLLRAIEEGVFLPLGSDKPVRSEFQLIAGTNRDLRAQVRSGSFREDLLSRIDLWAFELPSLRDRIEDLEPNLDYELSRFEHDHGRRVTFNKEARERFLGFATGPEGHWSGNFRDLNASITRLATLSNSGRIDRELVDEEVQRLRRAWGGASNRADQSAYCERVLSSDQVDGLDRFDRIQLEDVLSVCARTPNLSAAGRELFAESRQQKASKNDYSRLAKYLERFGIGRDDLTGLRDRSNRP